MAYGKENTLEVAEEFKQVFKNISSSMSTYVKSTGETCIFHDYDGMRIYVNQDASYMSITLLKKDYAFSIKKSGTKLSYGKGTEYNKKIELILLDAFVDTLKELNKLSGTALKNYESEIDRLFHKLLLKRNLKVDESQKDFQMKVYI